MRWMNLEPIIQSEVSQKEKDKYHILVRIHGTEEFICRTHSSVLAWRIPGTAEPGGHYLWGRTESDTTEVT